MKLMDYKFKPVELGGDEWNALASTCPDFNLLQSWEYGQSKSETGPWQVVRGIISTGNLDVGLAQVMVRRGPLGLGGLAWLNRGPLSFPCSGNPPVEFTGLLESVRNYFVTKKGFYLRVAPPKYTEESSQVSSGELQMAITNVAGWASGRVDLTKPNDELRRQMHGKWRNALSRAERENIQIKAGINADLFQEFLEGHREHLSRLGPDGGLPITFLQNFEDNLTGDDKLDIAVAYIKGRPAGGIAIAKYGKSAEYLSGYNSEPGRIHNVGQLLLWQMMVSLKERGYTSFDLGGMDPNLTPEGIFRFKKRINSVPYRLANEMESEAPGIINKLIRWRTMRARQAG